MWRSMHLAGGDAPRAVRCAMSMGMNLMTEGALRPIDGAISAPYLGSPSSTPVSVRMNPHEDVDLVRRVQAIGRAVSGDADFAAALESGRQALQGYAEGA